MANDIRAILSLDLSKPGTTLASAITDRDAMGQFLLAEDYLTAAHIMAEGCDHESRLLQPRYMLLCQGLELCLKAFLLDNNVPPSQLTRPPLNHDLATLLDRCLEYVASNEPFIGLEHQAIIRDLAPASSMFYFRYGHPEPASLFNVSSIHVPLMRDALEAGRALCSVVRHRVLVFPK